jgi:hypothetical protein
MRITGGQVTVLSAASGIIIFTAARRRLSEHAAVLDDFDAAQVEDEQRFLQRAQALIDTALAGVLMAYCSVEAAVNELMLAHRLGNAPNMPGFSPELAERLSQLWDCGAEKLDPLEKADVIGVVAGVGPFDRGSGAPQQVALLRSLRNELVHHKPELFETARVGPDSGDKLERSLHTLFAPAAIWRGRNVPFRWNGCLGADCAKWAYRNAYKFNQSLYATVGTRFPA